MLSLSANSATSATFSRTATAYLSTLVLTLAALLAVSPADVRAETDVTGLLDLSFSRMRISNTTGIAVARITRSGENRVWAKIINRSALALKAPLTLKIADLQPSATTLLNASGADNGVALINVPLADGVLSPGESARVRLQFLAKSRKRISFHAEVSASLPMLFTPRSAPGALAPDTQTEVFFSMPTDGGFTPGSLSFSLKNLTQNSTAAMNDNAQDGDLKAGDNVFGARLSISTNGLNPGDCLSFQGEASLNGAPVLNSAVYELCVTGFPLTGSIPNLSPQNIVPSPEVSAPDAQALADEVIIQIQAGTSESRINQIVGGVNGEVIDVILGLRLHLVRLPAGTDLSGALAILAAEPEVEQASSNGVVFGGAWPADPNTPNDNLSTTECAGGASSCALRKINAPEVWELWPGTTTLPGDGITVAVIDSGLDAAHPDLAGKSPVMGYDYIDNDNDPADENGHGTHVAGISSAITDNGTGVAAIAGGSSLYISRVLSDTGLLSTFGSTWTGIKGIEDAAAYGAEVINASFASPIGNYWCAAVENAITDSASGDLVRLIVIAAGNNGVNTASYWPGACNVDAANVSHPEGVIVVANSNLDDVLYTGPSGDSNYGSWVDMAAPGTDILSTVPSDTSLDISDSSGYLQQTGTSMSAGMVSGAAAVLLSCGISVDNIEAALLATAHTASDGDGGSLPRLDLLASLVTANVAPSSVALSNTSVAENTNTAAGQIIGNLSTVDSNTCDAATYSIITAFGDGNKFSLGGAAADQLILTDGILDFETKSSYQVRVRSTDAGNAFRNKTFNIQVSDVNEAPDLQLQPSNRQIPESTDTSSGVKISDIATIDDALGNEVFSLTGPDQASFEIIGDELWLKAGVVLDAAVKSEFNVTVQIDDPTVGGSPDSAAMQLLTILASNTAPNLVGAIPDQSNNEGDSVTLLVTDRFDDSDGDTLNFTATNLPNGLNISNQGVISGQIAAGAAAGSPYNVTVTATDPDSLSVNDTFVWTVSAGNNVTIDFDLDPNGNPVAGGTIVNNTYAALGVSFANIPGSGGCGNPPNVYASPNNGNLIGTGKPVSICVPNVAADFHEAWGVIEVSLAQPASQVCVDTSPTATNGFSFLEAYDAVGTLLTPRVNSTPAVTGTFCVTAAGIRKVRFSGSGTQHAVFDNLFIQY